MHFLWFWVIINEIVKGGFMTVMDKMKSILVVLLTFILLLSGCGNSSDQINNNPSNTTSKDESVTKSVTLPYTSTDSLDPFKVKTKSNGEIVRLLFDSLITVNENFAPTNVLADRIILTDESCSVFLKKTPKFTDGSPVTAKDVIYSINLARNAKDLYYSQNLINVSSVTEGSDGSVVISLKHADDYFTNLLDFPIIKANTDGKKNEDNKDIPPVGTGRYTFLENSGEYKLVSNKNWYGGKVNIEEINLLNLPDQDAVDYAVKSGKISICYSDLSNNTAPSMIGSSVYVPMNNLVYLGVSSSGVMTNLSIRRAISYGLNRAEIVTSAYYGAATPAKGIYHSSFYDAIGFQTISEKEDIENVEKNLKQAGFTKKEDSGYFYNKNNKQLSLTLVYNNSNSARGLAADLISKQLSKFGINITVKALPFAEYQNAIKYNSCDLYIAEIKIPANMVPYSLLTAGGIKTASHDDIVNEKGETVISAAHAAFNMQNGTGTLSETVSCFNEQLPVIPLCHRSGKLIYKGLSEGLKPTSFDPLNGLQNVSIIEK